MGINSFTGTLRRHRLILGLCLRRVASDADVGAAELTSRLNHHHHRLLCTSYNARSSQCLSKTRNISAPYNRSYSSSSSSSSVSKMGLLNWYLAKLDSRPVITKAMTASLIYAAADVTSQMITLPPSGTFDTIRTLRMAGFGMLIVGPGQHLWFNFVASILPKRDMGSTFKKMVIGQLVYGPTVNGVFFSFNAALQGENVNEIGARLKRDLLPTLMSGLMFWPMIDFLTFKVIPVHLQPLMNSSFSYIWTIYLTYMASLTKAEVE